MENNIVEDRELTLQSEVNEALNKNERFKFNLEELEIFERSHSQENLYSSLLNNTTLTRLKLHLYGGEDDLKYGYYFKDLLSKHTTLKSLHLLFEYELNDENIGFFCEGLRLNTTLTDLRMNWTGDTIEPLDTLMEEFKYNTTLKKLKLSFDSLHDPENQETSSICEALMHNTSLTSLSIGGVFIDAPALHTLMEVNCTITDLDLQFHEELKPVISHILRSNRTLKSLVLRGYGSFMYDNCLSGLKANQTLTKLDLEIDFAGDFTELFETFREAKSLKEISFSTINNERVGFLAEFIKQTTTLEKISFRLDLADDSWQLLSNAITANKSLTSIAIRSTDIFRDKECYLIQALMKSSILTDLKFESICKFDSKSIDRLTEILSTNRTLLSLHMSSVYSVSACSLFKCLLKNDTLKSLAVSGTGVLSDDGINEWVKVIETNSTIERLDVRIRTGDGHVQQLCKALKLNNTLRHLSLNVLVTAETVGTIDILKEVLLVNTTLTYLKTTEKIDYAIKPALEVNKKRFEELKKSFIVLLHNIVRDKETRLKLPLELWQQIFMQLKYSGIVFGATVKRIFNE